MVKSYKQNLSQINTLIFDVDGVLTNGNVTVMPNGQLVRQMNIKDGYALRTAVNVGFRICIITGGKNEGVRIRLQNLGIKNIYMGTQDKIKPYNELVDMYNLQSKNIMYMGDDIPDYPIMKIVGLACCPKDAVEEIQSISSYISNKNGGDGCVRDIIEQILRVQGKWKENYDGSYD
tara:strand:- start:33177 stop:33704 length:528 start_codon:yes stop_codon:yes gene_type:complete